MYRPGRRPGAVTDIMNVECTQRHPDRTRFDRAGQHTWIRALIYTARDPESAPWISHWFVLRLRRLYFFTDWHCWHCEIKWSPELKDTHCSRVRAS